MLRKQKLVRLRCLQGAPLSSQEEVGRTGLMRGFGGGRGTWEDSVGEGEIPPFPS